MPIQLDKILANIAEEKVLHPSYPDATKKDIDDAWSRVGKNNKLSVHEARSIFKVLQKKYEQEKQKGTSTWKLYKIMDEIHRKEELKPQVKQEGDTADLPMEEDEEYEMLEVQEEDEHGAHAAQSTGSASDSESPSKSMKSNSSTGSPEKDEKPFIKTLIYGTKQHTASSANSVAASHGEEKKLLNTMASATPRPAPPITVQTPSATAATLQKKGITMKKTLAVSSGSGNKLPSSVSNSTHNKSATARPGGHVLEVGKTIQLPNSIKRKLSEEVSTPQVKKINVGQSMTSATGTVARKSGSPQNPHTTTTQLMQVKQESDEQSTVPPAHGINLITIPANPTRTDLANNLVVGANGGASSSTAATVASTSTNGFSPRIEDIDFRNDIIFDAGNGINGTAPHKVNSTNASEIINLGNFDNSLPPTFFKNLCNSSRHEALGLYVANVMNRLRIRSAAKLELAILRAIIDVQSDELEQ